MPRLFLAREERRKAAAVTSSLQKGGKWIDGTFINLRFKMRNFKLLLLFLVWNEVFFQMQSLFLFLFRPVELCAFSCLLHVSFPVHACKCATAKGCDLIVFL